MKPTRTLPLVLTAIAGLLGLMIFMSLPPSGEAAPDLTTPSTTPTPRHRVLLPHVRYDLAPTPTATPTLPPTPQPPIYSASAWLTITRFKPLNASTFNTGSFIVGNDSLHGERLTELRLDLSTAIFPDMVFDPFGQAGDTVAKTYTLDNGLKQASYAFEGPHDGGFDVLVLRYNGFDPGDFSSFSIDVDPTSIKGVGAPGPAESGSVGGLELVGATVTATFDSGTTITGQVYRLADDGGVGGHHSGGTAVLREGLPPRPQIGIQGANPPAVVTAANQTVRVVGPPGQPVAVLVVEGGLFLDGVPNGGFDIDPFEANSAVDVREYTAVVGGSGFVDVPIILMKQNAQSGIHAITAVFDNHYGLKGLVAAPLVLELE